MSHSTEWNQDFILQNLHLINQINIDPWCYTSSPCQHHVKVHLETSPFDEWIEFKNVSATNLLPFYDLISQEWKKHFEYLFPKSLNIPLMIERTNKVAQDRLDERNRIIDSLRSEIKELNFEIVNLKYPSIVKGLAKSLKENDP